ncbi:hypothetical protein L204_105107 [Cryptococcus depauperatus]|nr:hypothetical protein L204_03755 [Cryptococcus depauperatus CBS 7855]
MQSLLPNFLQQSGSPLRSPHVEQSSFFASAFASHTQPMSGHPRSSLFLRPTRRDLLLCIVTLSFSYLLFSPPLNTQGVSVNPAFASKYSHSWGRFGSFFPASSSTSCPQINNEVIWSETVKPVGFGVAGSGKFRQGTKVWAGGEEEEEDDEFQTLSTVLKAHSPGWTIFEKLYIHNGSFYVVTENKDEYPELRMMISTGLPANNEPGNIEAREPRGNEIKYITPIEAAKFWGSRVYRLDGTTFLFNDGQFIDHYYHFAAELLLGAWRAYASYDQDISANGETTLVAPKRMWFLHQSVNEWRDKLNFNPTLLFALFPRTAILYPEDFRDFVNLTLSDKPKAFVLDRAILADRSAAFRGPFTNPTARTVAGALQVGTTSKWWWEPVRRAVLRYAGLDEDIIARNLEGHGAVDPVLLHGAGVDVVEPLSLPGTYNPVITYISRQNSRRHLTPESHADLVNALTERAKKLNWELVIVEAEKMSKEEQFALAGRTTIMLGVHGNGLTHLIWMPATPRSAVIELFYKGGFARDYQWTAHALGIRHFAIQHDVIHTSPSIPLVSYPEGFQGTAITVSGKVVADLIENQLAGRL